MSIVTEVVQVEGIVQGAESSALADTRRARWLARDTDPVNTPTTLEDLERLVLGMTGATQLKLANAKRKRGEPMPS